MLIPHGTLVAVADGSGLSLYRNSGTEIAPKLSPLPTPKLDPHSKDSGKRHRASLANPDSHIREEDSLAAAIAEWLNQQALEGKLEHVAVVAPAKFLGEMRRNYHKALQAKLVVELVKDLRERPPEQIEAELKRASAS